MLVYLAGGLRTGWQDDVVGVRVLDPRTWQDHDPAVYTARDLAALRGCDAVLAYMDASNPSGFGLSLEVGYAHALGKPIAFVDAMGCDPRARYFAMLREIAQVFTDIGAATAWLKGL